MHHFMMGSDFWDSLCIDFKIDDVYNSLFQKPMEMSKLRRLFHSDPAPSADSVSQMTPGMPHSTRLPVRQSGSPSGTMAKADAVLLCSFVDIRDPWESSQRGKKPTRLAGLYKTKSTGHLCFCSEFL